MATEAANTQSSALDDELGVPSDATLSLPKGTASASLVSSDGLENQQHQTFLVTSRAAGRCVLVGRQAATADIRIQHGSISRKHAALYFFQDRLCIKDLGTKHGFSVNGERIPAGHVRTLHHSDTIVFGNFQTAYQVKLSETTETIHPVDDNDGLTGRAKREAEIAAMMASLDAPVTYQKYQEKPEPTAATTMKQPKYAKSLPIQSTLHLPSEAATASHKKNVVTCISVDPAGARFVIGSRDSYLRIYDFNAMDQIRQESLRTVLPQEGHVIHACTYSSTGDRILVATGGVQPIILSREGEEILKFMRGDMYVSDPSKTVGHTAATTSVDWHPFERDIVLTGSLDGSARIWNLKGKTQFKMLVCDKVYLAKNACGQKTAVTAVCFHPGGREFAIGTACGSIQVWTRTSLRTERAIHAVHGEGRPISSLCYNADGSMLASRSVDDVVVKLWDSKSIGSKSRLQQSVECKGLDSMYDAANACFSPDGKFLCAAKSCLIEGSENERREDSSLNFYSTETGKAVAQIPFDDNISGIVVKWHAKLNQIFVGLSDGSVQVFYDAHLSTKGALVTTGKAGRNVDALSELLSSRAPQGLDGITGEIVTPLYQEMEVNPNKRKRKDRKDPAKSREPERPATGKHKTGGQTGGMLSFDQFVSDQSLTKSKAIAGADPREALFRYTEGKSMIGNAYDGNETKLAKRTAEEDSEPDF